MSDPNQPIIHVNVPTPNVDIQPQNIIVNPAQVNIPPNDNAEAIKANRLSRISIILNTALFLLSFGISIYSVWLSREAMTVTRTQFETESRPKIQITNFLIDSPKNSFAFDSTNFEIQPFVSLEKLDSVTLKRIANQIMSIKKRNYKSLTFDIINIGKSPAKISSVKFHIYSSESPVSWMHPDKYEGPSDSIRVTLFDSSTCPFFMGDESGMPQDLDGFYKNGGRIFLTGEISYTNLYSKKAYITHLGYELRWEDKKVKITNLINEDAEVLNK